MKAVSTGLTGNVANPRMMTRIDCHLSLEDEEGERCNVVYADNMHQVALSVRHKVIVEEETAFHAMVDLTGEVQMALIDLETGCPLEQSAGWRWSMEKAYPIRFQYRDGETGSKPQDKSGYTTTTIYVSHAQDLEAQGSVLVGVRFTCGDIESYGVVLGQSTQGVRIHKSPMKIGSPSDFQGELQVDHGADADSNYYWDPGYPDFDCMWRSANVFLYYSNTSKTVSAVAYQSGRLPIYSTRRRNLYEVASYVWPMESAPTPGQNISQSISLFFPKGNTGNYPAGEIQKTITYRPKNAGFVLTLVCYPRVDQQPLDDTWPSKGGPSNTVTVWDEVPQPSTYYLNQRIPDTWLHVKADTTNEHSGDPNYTFSNDVVTDSSEAGALYPNIKTNGYLNNFQYGNVNAVNSWYQDNNGNQDLVAICGGATWNIGTQNYDATDFQLGMQYTDGIYYLLKTWGGDDGDGDYVIGYQGENYVFASLLPKWDTDGFTVQVYVPQANNSWMPMKAENAWPNRVFASSTTREESRFLWGFWPVM